MADQERLVVNVTTRFHLGLSLQRWRDLFLRVADRARRVQILECSVRLECAIFVFVILISFRVVWRQVLVTVIMRDLGNRLRLIEATFIELTEEVGPFVVGALHHELLHDSLLVLLLLLLTLFAQHRQVLAFIRKHVVGEVPILVLLHLPHSSHSLRDFVIRVVILRTHLLEFLIYLEVHFLDEGILVHDSLGHFLVGGVDPLGLLLFGGIVQAALHLDGLVGVEHVFLAV